MSLTPEEREEHFNFIRKHCEEIGERFDSVQIFVTRHEPGAHDGTINLQYGAGNWFTRYGQVKNWIVREDEKEREFTRRDAQ